MFLRIDKDLFINIMNIFSYKLLEFPDSYKLIIWGSNGTQVHQVIYLKQNEAQMNLLIEVNEKLREHLINPDVYIPQVAEEEPVEEVIEEKEYE